MLLFSFITGSVVLGAWLMGLSVKRTMLRLHGPETTDWRGKPLKQHELDE